MTIHDLEQYREAADTEAKLQRRLDRLTSHREWLEDTIADANAKLRRLNEAQDDFFFRTGRAH